MAQTESPLVLLTKEFESLKKIEAGLQTADEKARKAKVDVSKKCQAACEVQDAKIAQNALERRLLQPRLQVVNELLNKGRSSSSTFKEDYAKVMNQMLKDMAVPASYWGSLKP